MKKTKFLLFYIVASIILNLTCVYVLSGVWRAIYLRDSFQGDYTFFMRIADYISKFDIVLKFFWMSLGASLMCIAFLIWDWMGFENA